MLLVLLLLFIYKLQKWSRRIKKEVLEVWSQNVDYFYYFQLISGEQLGGAKYISVVSSYSINVYKKEYIIIQKYYNIRSNDNKAAKKETWNINNLFKSSGFLISKLLIKTSQFLGMYQHSKPIRNYFFVRLSLFNTLQLFLAKGPRNLLNTATPTYLDRSKCLYKQVPTLCLFQFFNSYLLIIQRILRRIDKYYCLIFCILKYNLKFWYIWLE